MMFSSRPFVGGNFVAHRLLKEIEECRLDKEAGISLEPTQQDSICKSLFPS